MQTFHAKRLDQISDLPNRIDIAVTRNYDGTYTPETAQFGMGKNYSSATAAAKDYARRHGYTVLALLDHVTTGD